MPSSSTLERSLRVTPPICSVQTVPELFLHPQRLPPIRRMAGIVIFTAGREDAHDDYQTSVRDGHPVGDLQPYLSESRVNDIAENYEDDTVHLWGTSVGSKWEKVDQSDITLVYRDGSMIARAQVVDKEENLELARDLWDTTENPWDEKSPWKYLTFVTPVEEIDVEVTAFNELVGYDASYRPQGFTRVADYRIDAIEAEWDSIETALADLTGTGERVHTIQQDDDPTAEQDLGAFTDDLIAAGEDGERSEEFEQLVAEAFSRLGCEAQWIEGGGDTDVELLYPVHAVVEAKTRSRDSGIVQMPANRIESHREQREADMGLVVGRHFPPSSNEDAKRSGLRTLTTARLARLVELRSEYGITSERVFKVFADPGPVQDDRLDLLEEHVQDRVAAIETLLDVLKAMAKSDDPGNSPREIRMIIIGMRTNSGHDPLVSGVEEAIDFLAHPGLALLEENDNGYRLTTTYENAVRALGTIDRLIEDAREFGPP